MKQERRVFTLPFTIAVLLVTALAGVKIWQNAEWQRLDLLSRQQWVAAERANENYLSYVMAVTWNIRTQREIELALNGGKPIKTTPLIVRDANDRPETLDVGILTDAKTGGSVQFTFHEGRRRGCRAANPPRFVTIFPAGWWVGEELRSKLLQWTPLCWFAGLIFSVFVWNHLRPVAWVSGLLSVTIIWLAANLVSFNAFANQFMTSNTLRDCVWPALAFVVTLAWLKWLGRPPIDNSRCRDCGYDLTANVSGVCPECGTSVITPVRQGEIQS